VFSLCVCVFGGRGGVTKKLIKSESEYKSSISVK
jgi:hypothetical protein